MTGTGLERQEPAAVDPLTMEVIDLATIDHADLVDVFARLQTYEARAKAWRTAVEDELVRRHGERRAAQVVGDYEVAVDRGWSRKWDVEDLLGALRGLIADGHMTPAEADRLYKIKTERVADGRALADLLGQLERTNPEAHRELSSCFSWEQRGRAKVKLTPVATLEAGE